MAKGFSTPEKVIYVCTGSKCKKKGGKEIGRSIREQIKEMGLKGKVEVVKTDCTDRCDYAPVICMQPANIWLSYTTEQTAKEAFNRNILKAE
jgi:NADH:ubiquinone oxidoreductase subunit E